MVTVPRCSRLHPSQFYFTIGVDVDSLFLETQFPAQPQDHTAVDTVTPNQGVKICFWRQGFVSLNRSQRLILLHVSAVFHLKPRVVSNKRTHLQQ